MTVVGKALWFIESHFATDITLEDVASSAGVSQYHLCRAFESATGSSVMRYVRTRRLSEAARALSNGATDILSVALEAGYGSHEAFTRAFKELFGVTPKAARSLPQRIELKEAIRVNETPLPGLEAPRFVDGRPLLIVGVAAQYAGDPSAGIPAQWQRFGPHLGNVPGQVGTIAYGVCIPSDERGSFEYICGVEVVEGTDVPLEWSRIRIPAQSYAVFTHRDHVSTIRGTFAVIWNQWLPDSGRTAASAPFFERYGPEFDPRSGLGGLEIWIPLQGSSA